jgi:CBS domain-containing protein
MRKRKVEEIILPYREGIPVSPSVTAGDKITHAIELMVSHNLKSIAVVRHNRPVGMARLEDAFQKIGLKAVGEKRPT